MTARKKPDWEVKAYGKQVDPIDIDLLLQLVIMLGYHLAEEANESEMKGGCHDDS